MFCLKSLSVGHQTAITNAKRQPCRQIFVAVHKHKQLNNGLFESHNF